MSEVNLWTGIATAQPVLTAPTSMPIPPALTGMVVGPVPNSDFLAALYVALEEFSRKASLAAAPSLLLENTEIKQEVPQGENFSFTAPLTDSKVEIKDMGESEEALAALFAANPPVSAPPILQDIPSTADALIKAIEEELSSAEGAKPQGEAPNPFINAETKDVAQGEKKPLVSSEIVDESAAEEVITAEKYLESYADMLKAAKEVLQWVKMDQIESEAEAEGGALFEGPVKEASVELSAEEALIAVTETERNAPAQYAAVSTAKEALPVSESWSTPPAAAADAPQDVRKVTKTPEKAPAREGGAEAASSEREERKLEAKDAAPQEPQKKLNPQETGKPLEAESVKLTRAAADTETPKVKVESPQKVEGEAKSVPAPSPEAKAEGATETISRAPAPVKIQTEEDAPAKGERLAFAAKEAKTESLSQRADTPVKAPAPAPQAESPEREESAPSKAPVKEAVGKSENMPEGEAPVTASEGEEVAEKHAEPAQKDVLPKGETGFAAKDASTDSDNFKRGEKVERTEARQETATVRTSSDAPKFESALKAPASSNQAERVAEIETAKDAVKIAKLVQQAGQNGETKLTVQLKPEHLGRLVIELTDANGRLDAKIIAQSAESKNFLNSHGQEIVKQLAERGIHIDNMDFAFHDSLTKEQNERSLGQKRAKLPKHLDGGGTSPVEEELKVERDEVYA